MNRSLVVLLLISITLLGALSAWTLASSAGDRSGTEASLATLSRDLARLAEAVDATSAELAAEAQERTRVLAALDRLESRLQATHGAEDARSLDVPAAPPAASGGPQPAPAATGDVASAEEAGALRDEFLALLAAGVLDEGGTREQQQRFWELTRTSPVLTELIADLEQRVEAAPDDTEARMQLADAYVAKLLTVPGGPERGLWGERAEEQWLAIAAADPQHWDSRFALGENYSYYPPFMNKAGDALAHLTAARAIQEARPPEPAHTRTYVLLARVQAQQGQHDAARATLQAGLLRHPGDPELLAALEGLK